MTQSEPPVPLFDAALRSEPPLTSDSDLSGLSIPELAAALVRFTYEYSLDGGENPAPVAEHILAEFQRRDRGRTAAIKT